MAKRLLDIYCARFGLPIECEFNRGFYYIATITVDGKVYKSDQYTRTESEAADLTAAIVLAQLLTEKTEEIGYIKATKEI
jgi:hypothetical protein